MNAYLILAGVAGGRGRVATPLSHLVISIDRALHPCIFQCFLNLIGKENHINVTFKKVTRWLVPLYKLYK